MKITKKLISLATATVMSIAALCSCTNTHTVLNTFELLPNWDGYQTTGSVNIVLADDVKESIKNTSTEDDFTDTILASDMVIYYTLTQKDEMMSVTGTVSIANSNYDYDVITCGTDVYISVDTLNNALYLSNQIDGDNASSDETFDNLIENGIEYVKVSKEDLTSSSFVSDDVLDILKNEFMKNIDLSSILTVNDNVITLTADGLDLLNIFINTASKLTVSAEKLSLDTFNINDILDVLRSISNNTYDDEDANAELYGDIRDILNDVQIDFTATVFDDYVNESLNISVLYNSIKIISDNKTVAYTGEISIPTSFITESEAKEYYNASAEHDFSTVIIWWDNNAVLSIDNVNIAYKDGTSKSMTCTVINKDDRIYLPLRSISEGMGYEVTWDGEKAGVIVNGENVEISGFIKDDRTYIKVRDFEKLGIEVEYFGENEFGIHTAILFNE